MGHAIEGGLPMYIASVLIRRVLAVMNIENGVVGGGGQFLNLYPL